jgi:hypothetical protein
MAKQSGLGDRLFVGGYDLSGDIQELGTIGGGPAAIDVTDITQQAHGRLGGLRDGTIDTKCFFDPTVAHPVLSALPRADTLLTYCRGAVLGAPAACLNGKQIDYNPTRGNSGELTIAVQAQANGYGLEWGTQLTAGMRTDAAATSGPSVDLGAAAAFGFQAYLQLAALTGTDVTVKIQDSADGATWADLAGGAFTAAVAAPAWQRIAVGGTATVRRYVRAVTTTTGGFTSATFSVVLVQNQVEVAF